VPPHSVDDFVHELHRLKTEHFKRMLQGGAIRFRPGVLQLLREARDSGVRLAIATTTSPENVTGLLAAAPISGLRDWFDVIAAGDVVPTKKPAPDIFELALRRLGLPANCCVAVEDSDSGARSALGAGLSALLVTVSSYTLEQDFRGAALVVDGLGEPTDPPRVLGGGCAVRVDATLRSARCVNLSVLRVLHRCVYGDG
jgi:HAD superfamily hydrolase (TIGR01509 family)